MSEAAYLSHKTPPMQPRTIAVQESPAAHQRVLSQGDVALTVHGVAPPAIKAAQTTGAAATGSAPADPQQHAPRTQPRSAREIQTPRGYRTSCCSAVAASLSTGATATFMALAVVSKDNENEAIPTLYSIATVICAAVASGCWYLTFRGIRN